VSLFISNNVVQPDVTRRRNRVLGVLWHSEVNHLVVTVTGLNTEKIT